MELHVGAVKGYGKNIALYSKTNFFNVEKLLGDVDAKNLRVWTEFGFRWQRQKNKCLLKDQKQQGSFACDCIFQ